MMKYGSNINYTLAKDCTMYCKVVHRENNCYFIVNVEIKYYFKRD